MKRTYKLIVDTSEHPDGTSRYLVTLSDEKRGVIVEHGASSLKVCIAAVTGRLLSDDAGAEQ